MPKKPLSKQKSAQKSITDRRTLYFLAVVMLINALSYGTIIPLLYPYASRFGLDAFGFSLLFVSFSLFQFLATPIIGRLSDIYGRRPLILGSVLGTAISLSMFALATSVPMLFLARILDGITGGNMSVAQAVIADTLKGKARAQAFGMLGASFGFGFLVGPALGGYLSEISLTAPFWVASALALTATIFGYFFLDETLPKHKRSDHADEPLFNLGKLIQYLKVPIIGMLLLTILTVSLAQNAFIIGFQAFTVDVLSLSPRNIGLLFAVSGLVNILVQSVGIRLILNKFHNHEAVIMVLQAGAAVLIGLLAFMSSFFWFTAVLFAYLFFNAPLQTILSSMTSERSNGKNQGALLGVATSYMSLGQIGGPFIAGMVAKVNVPWVFLVASILLLLSLVISYRASVHAKLHAVCQA